MKINKGTLAFLILLLATFSVARAQSPTGMTPEDEAEAKVLRKQFDNFVKAYSKIEQTKDKQSVLKFMAKEVRATLVSFDMAKNSSIRYTDLKSFEAHLDELINSEDMQIKYEVSDVLRTYVNRNVGVVAYSVDYEIKKNGNNWSRGTESVTITFMKLAGEWRIIQYSVVAMEDEKWRGSCLCELFSDGTGQYVAKTMIPTGRNYATMLNHFDFTEVKGERIIKVNEHTFRWSKTGEIWRKVRSNVKNETTETLVGNTPSDDKRDAVLVLLRSFLYTDNCTGIRVTNGKVN